MGLALSFGSSTGKVTVFSTCFYDYMYSDNIYSKDVCVILYTSNVVC